MTNNFSSEALAEVIKCSPELLQTMTHYKELSITGRILFAAMRNDTTSTWTDVTLQERAKQDLENEQKKLARWGVTNENS